ncbi:MAG: ABC transporter ATP-binding protein [Trueperaceae bacterium]|nr:ABC transporter ATP-binding protein [Trueperaceae bacterium]
MSAPLLRLQGVRVAYGDGRTVLDGVDLDVAAGDRLAIGGVNGAGKSTLLRTMMGLQRLSAGRVWAYGRERLRPRDFHEVRLRTGLLFQTPEDQLFCPTVREDVAFGPRNQGLGPADADARCDETLAALGLQALASRATHRLSGGEARLVALATVLAMRPEVLLLDEPLLGLDEENERRLVGILADLPQAMVVVGHERHLERTLGLRAWRLAAGRLHPA